MTRVYMYPDLVYHIVYHLVHSILAQLDVPGAG